MSVLVTGANGFVGGYLVEQLALGGKKIYAVQGPNGTTQKVSDSSVEWFRLDLTDSEAVRKLVERVLPSEVYHLAGVAVTHGIPTETYFRNNVLATCSLAQSVLDVCGNRCKMLFVSSAGVYGKGSPGGDALDEADALHPVNEYGASKASAEMFLRPLMIRGLDIRIARPFNHTGPGQTRGFVCPDLVLRLKESIANARKYDEIPRMRIGNLNSVRDFTDVRDVVRAYQLIMEHFKCGEVVNVASGRGVSVRQIVDMICYEIAHLHQINVVQDPMTQTQDEYDVIVGDSNLLTNRTGWKPRISLSQTLSDLWQSVGEIG